MAVHPTAVVHDGAELGDVEIGPFAVVQAGVVLRDGVRIGAHAVIQGPTVLGEGTTVHAHAVIGGPPQDAKHDGSATRLVVGKDCVFREFTTAHRGSSGGRGLTEVGDRVYVMANAHIGHDCTVGSDVMLANSVALGGHATVGDGAILGGLAGVHQNARIGRLAMVGGGAMCAQDVPPFTIAQGDRARLFGLNVIGLRRAGFDTEVMAALKSSWRLIFNSGASMRTASARARADYGHVAEVAELLDFLSASTRGVCRGASHSG